MVRKTYSEIKKEARVFYTEWRKTGSYCPAFKEKILVTNRGWYHLIGKTGNKKRVFRDVHRRLALLPHAKTILENAGTIQNIRTQNGRQYYSLDSMEPVTENGVTHLRKVRVIVFENKKGQKVFYSVMDKK